MIAAASSLAVAGLLVWAWRDGGERELRPISAPAMLPEVSQ